jgi:hypothetical protein
MPVNLSSSRTNTILCSEEHRHSEPFRVQFCFEFLWLSTRSSFSQWFWRVHIRFIIHKQGSFALIRREITSNWHVQDMETNAINSSRKQDDYPERPINWGNFTLGLAGPLWVGRPAQPGIAEQIPGWVWPCQGLMATASEGRRRSSGGRRCRQNGPCCEAAPRFRPPRGQRASLWPEPTCESGRPPAAATGDW